MAKKLMAEEDEEDVSSVADSADQTNDEDSVMEEDGPVVNGIAH